MTKAKEVAVVVVVGLRAGAEVEAHLHRKQLKEIPEVRSSLP